MRSGGAEVKGMVTSRIPGTDSRPTPALTSQSAPCGHCVVASRFWIG
jgi:hypothetical protein